MKRFLSIIMVAVMLMSVATVCASAQKNQTLYIIGDGIAAATGEDMYPAQGWGEYFKDVVKDIDVVNAARHKTDMTGFIAGGHWQEIAQNLTEDDFVLVAFGAESIDSRGKAHYSKALTKYALDAKRKGAEIIFATPAPIVNSLAQNEKLTPMTESIKAVAKLLGVHVVDVNGDMLKDVESDSGIKSLYHALYLSNMQNSYHKQRGTVSEFAQEEASEKTGVYLSNQGAKHVANVAARSLYKSNTKLKKYIKNVDDPTERPVHYDVLTEMNKGEIRGILYDGMDYMGVPTQVFAYLGIPEGVSAQNPAPAMVLVHGGGGKAYLDWVKLWVKKGYVALSYYFMESKTSMDNRLPDNNVIHYNGGPRRQTGIDDATYSTVTQDKQWMYHATSDASLAYTLLDSLPEVQDGQIGISGISWGGIVTASVIGRDTRFKLAMPVYGAGYLDENLGSLKSVSSWDGKHHFENVKESGMKTLWINSPTDYYFDVTTTTKSAAACGGDPLILYNFSHGEPSGSGLEGTLNEVFNFADSVFRGGDALPKLSAPKRNGSNVTVTATSDVGIKSATLYYTAGGVLYGSSGCESLWLYQTAEVSGNKISATIPSGTKGYYIQVTDNNGNRITTGYQEK